MGTSSGYDCIASNGGVKVNIRKWYLKLDNEKQKEIERIVDVNRCQGWAKINGLHSICFEIFEYDIFDMWWIGERNENITNMIYDYVSRILFLRENPEEYAKYRKMMEVSADG